MNSSLPQQIAQRLQTMILEDEQYEPNEKIPNERTLAEELGVSRASIREAIKILVGNGVLTVRRGVGTFVAANPNMSRDPLGLQRIEDRLQLLLEWYQIRLMLEPAEMDILVDTITPEERKELRRRERACARAARAGEPFSDLDTEFHICLARATHNRILERLMEGVSESVETGIMTQQDQGRENAAYYHRLIVDYIELGDRIGAYNAMRQHLLLGQKNARKLLQRKKEAEAAVAARTAGRKED